MKIDNEDIKIIMKWIRYIDETNELMQQFDEVGQERCERETIRNIYGKLKDEIRKESHYWSLSKNKSKASKFAKDYYIPAISGASAWGFTVPKNASVNKKMYCAVEEANYKLKKIKNSDELKKLLEKNKEN